MSKMPTPCLPSVTLLDQMILPPFISPFPVQCVSARLRISQLYGCISLWKNSNFLMGLSMYTFQVPIFRSCFATFIFAGYEFVFVFVPVANILSHPLVPQLGAWTLFNWMMQMLALMFLVVFSHGYFGLCFCGYVIFTPWPTLLLSHLGLGLAMAELFLSYLLPNCKKYWMKQKKAIQITNPGNDIVIKRLYLYYDRKWIH